MHNRTYFSSIGQIKLNYSTEFKYTYTPKTTHTHTKSKNNKLEGKKNYNAFESIFFFYEVVVNDINDH